MEMNISPTTKDVEIWLSKAEGDDFLLREQLKVIYAECKKNGHSVFVYYSGDHDLYQRTLDLLSYNKKRLAELKAKAQKDPEL